MTRIKPLMLIGSICLVVVLALPLVAACAGPAPTPTPAKIFKVAMLTQQTGYNAEFGLGITNPQLMYAEEVNAEGGLLVAGERYHVEVVVCDTVCEPTLARACWEKVVNQGIKIIMANCDTGMEGHYEVQGLQEIMVVSTAWPQKHYDSTRPYNFGCYPPALMFSRVFFRSVPVREGVESVAGIYRRGTTNDQVHPTDIAAAKNFGVEWLGTEWYEPGTIDFAPFVTAAMAQNPDMILMGYNGGDQAIIIRTIREQGFTGVIGSTLGEDVASYVEKIGAEYVEGYYQVEGSCYPPGPEMGKFQEEYIAKWGEYHANAPAGWYLLRLICKAVQKAGTIDDIPKISRAMEQVTIKCTILPGSPELSWGGLETYGQAHLLQTPCYLTQVINGEPITVDTILPEVP